MGEQLTELITLQINRSLKSINLKGNEITCKGAKTISVVLTAPLGFEECSKIEMISLNGNPIGDDGVASIALMLQSNFQIKLVDLGNTDLRAKGIIAMCSALSVEGSMLEVLSLERPLIMGYQDIVAVRIANMLAANQYLKSLNLAKFDMSDDVFETIVANGLLQNSSLYDLDLHGNKLSGFSGVINAHQKLVTLPTYDSISSQIYHKMHFTTIP